MRAVMGNLLETDSDVASISDTEKERTEGDGMESDSLLNSNQQQGVVDSSVPLENEEICDPKGGTSETTKTTGASDLNRDSISSSSSSTPQLQVPANLTRDVPLDPNLSREIGPADVSVLEASILASCNKSDNLISASPTELPPRSQLIQLKATMMKPRLSVKNGLEPSPDGINKQKNPKFIPYEPYKGAVRPIVGHDNRPKKLHSRTASDTSISSCSFEHVADSSLKDVEPLMQAQNSSENTQSKHGKDQKRGGGLEACVHKQEQIIQKQTHALTLVKERLKIAEKDNHELHKENTRLKKLLVDSLSGDLFHSQVGRDPDMSGNSLGTKESFDALSDEIEVWRSKFLSSCVLVEQLTRENSILNEAVGSATSIFKGVKLNGCLPQDHFEVINAWLRINRTSPLPNELDSYEEET